MEAWLLLFPPALTSHVSSWRIPRQYQGRDTGTVGDPKKVLKSATGTRRPYREADAPEVFAKAVALGVVRSPSGSNRSWDQLLGDGGDCCRQHMGQG
jgi:hypothetical protein